MTPLCRHGVVGASRLLRMGNRASFHASRAVGPGLSRSRSRLRLFVSVRWSEARPGNSADVVDSATLSQSGWRSETTGGLLSRSVALHSRGREPDGAETRHRPAARFHRARSQHSPPAGKAGSRTPNVGSMKLARLRPSAGLSAGQSMQSAVGPGQCLCSWLLPVSLWRVEASLANSCTNLVPPRGRVGGRRPAVPGLRSVEAVSAASASGPVEGAGLSAWAPDPTGGFLDALCRGDSRHPEVARFRAVNPGAGELVSGEAEEGGEIMEEEGAEKEEGGGEVESSGGSRESQGRRKRGRLVWWDAGPRIRLRKEGGWVPGQRGPVRAPPGQQGWILQGARSRSSRSGHSRGGRFECAGKRGAAGYRGCGKGGTRWCSGEPVRVTGR